MMNKTTDMIKRVILAAAMLMSLVACGKKEKPDPTPIVFPEHVVKYADPGSSVSISFDASRDWELRIPSENTAWFYFMDDGMPAYVLRGQKGRNTVDVYAKVVETHDQKSTEVNMTMEGNTQSIATVYMNVAEREIALFSAAKNEAGSYTPVGSGEYEYESGAASSLYLDWPKGMSGYMLPIKVQANFAWSMSSFPKWLNPSKTTTEGNSTCLILFANAAELPLDDSSSKIEFLDLSTGKKVSEIGITVRGCKDIAVASCSTDNINLNVLGQYFQNDSWHDEGCPVYLTATSDSKVIPVLLDGGKMSYSSDGWVKISKEEDTSTGVLRDMLFHVAADRNNDDQQREALLLAMPGSVLKGLNLESDLFNASKTALKEEYAKYKFASLVQSGMSGDWGNIIPLNSAYKMAVYGGGVERTSSSDKSYAALKAKYSTEEIYTVGLNNWYSADNIQLSANAPYTSAIYYSDGAEKTSDDYITVDAANPNAIGFSIDYFEEGHESVVVLKNGADAVAVLICRMTEKYWPSVKYTDIYFVVEDSVTEETREEMMPKGATLSELKSGEVYEAYKEYGIPVWSLSYQSEESKRNAMIYVPPFPATSEGSILVDAANKAWLNVEGSITESGKIYIQVSMTAEAPSAGKSGVIVLTGGGRPLFVLVCERRFI